jgi:hypothetical protein
MGKYIAVFVCGRICSVLLDVCRLSPAVLVCSVGALLTVSHRLQIWSDCQLGSVPLAPYFALLLLAGR